MPGDLHHRSSTRGGLGWLYRLTLLFVRNDFKFVWIGPVSLIQLIRARARARERSGRSLATRVLGTVDMSDPASSLSP